MCVCVVCVCVCVCVYGCVCPPSDVYMYASARVWNVEAAIALDTLSKYRFTFPAALYQKANLFLKIIALITYLFSQI